jgi:hypothetical protein
MKFRTLIYTLLAIALILLLVAAGGAYWIVSRGALTVPATVNPSTAFLIPKRSAVVVSLLVNPDRLKATAIATASPPNRNTLRRQFNRYQRSLLADSRLDYNRDIRPWLGDEITVALTTADIDRNRANGQKPGYLVVATTPDLDLAKATLEVFWQRQAARRTPLVFEPFAGVTLTYTEPQRAETDDLTAVETLATTVVGDRFVLLANSPKVLRSALNSLQVAELSLGNSPVYEQISANLKPDQLGFAILNLPAIASEFTANATTLLPRHYESLALSFRQSPQGLLADTSLSLSDGETWEHTQPRLSQPVSALKWIPATSALSLGGTNLTALWTQLADEPIAQQVRSRLQQRWGVDLPQDLLSWMEGDYALGLLPRPDRPQPDWVFVTPQSPATTAGLEHLKAIAQSTGVSTGSFMLNEQSIDAWTKLVTKPVRWPRSSSRAKETKPQRDIISIAVEVEGVHTVVNGYEIFTTSLEAMDQVLQTSEDGILNSADFQRAITALPVLNHGYLYVNGTALRELGQLSSGKFSSAWAATLLDAVRSVTFGSYGEGEKSAEGKMLIQLQVD